MSKPAKAPILPAGKKGRSKAVPVLPPEKRGGGNGAKQKDGRLASVATRTRAIALKPGAEEAAAQWVDASSLVLWKANPKAPTRAEVEGVARSIIRFGFGAPLLARLADREVIAGHTRLQAVRLLPSLWEAASKEERKGWSLDALDMPTLARVPCRFLDLTEEDAHLLALADNELGADWEPAALLEMLRQLKAEERAIAGWSEEAFAALLGDGEAGPASGPGTGPNLQERFGAPPFSVLDARQGYWQTRKREWLSLGIASEVGRGENLLKFSDSINAAQAGKRPYKDKPKPAKKAAVA